MVKLLISQNVQLYIILIKYVIVVMQNSKRRDENVNCVQVLGMWITLHCKPMLNLWNYRGFIIQTFSEYDQVVEGCKKFMDSKKKKVLLG